MQIKSLIRHITRNHNGSFPIIETLITVGVSVILLTVYFTSTINLYTIYERPDSDLNAKSVGVLEKLLNSPGQDSNYSQNWEDSPSNISILGLGTSPTVSYGIIEITDEGEVIVHSQHSFASRIGPVEMSFLANTKILMADGSYKNIEDISVGDIVRSYDIENNKLVDGRVNSVFHFSDEEMIDYYLLLNDVLKVTPDHRFYSNGEWVYAGDLKTGDILYQPSCEYTIRSIEKIFEKNPTYDLEIDVYHNYFVAMDETGILVHNDVVKEPANYKTPIASFTWFDCDGIGPNREIFFDASDSYFFSGERWYSWWWDWDYDESTPPDLTSNFVGQYSQLTNTYYDTDLTHVVRLKINDTWGTSSVVKIIQVNTYDFPYITPWTEDHTNIYPETGTETTIPYDDNYYIEYTELSGYDGYYLYEIKEKISNPTPIVDFDKVNSLMTVNYFDAKKNLGLNTTEYSMYNFNIELVDEDDAPLIPSYGAGYDDPDMVLAMYSSSKEVLIYYKPKVNSIDDVKKPYYAAGRITVRLFIGGEEPNYPPFLPRNPAPSNHASGVPWNAVLSWMGGDPNGDPVNYDVCFGTTDPPSLQSFNQSDTSFDPGSVLPLGLMNPNTKYYWNITAKDSYSYFTKGPVWDFTTAVNNPPYAPSNPNPVDNEIYVSVIDTVLSWSCGDPDQSMGDTVKYDVYFGASDECAELTEDPSPGGEEEDGGEEGDDTSSDDKTMIPPLAAQDLTSKYWNPSPIGRLRYNTTYYWKIVARDRWGLETASPIWNFTTIEKGLDQYNTEGSGKGINTSEEQIGSIGQTFTSGTTGYLTGIELSLKYNSFGAQQLDEDINVHLYTYIENEIQGDLLADAVIPSFGDSEYCWKKITFETPVPVVKGEKYFIVVDNTELRKYSWQYSSLTSEPGPGTPEDEDDYPYGDAYFKPEEAGVWIMFEKSVLYDFLFKTYVFREPVLGQSCTDQAGEGECTTNGKDYFDLAQTFIPWSSGDLMNVRVSLMSAEAQPVDITVGIYEEDPEKEDSPGRPLGNSTITVTDPGEFQWIEANFENENIAYLEEDITYFIIISVQEDSVYWEKSETEECCPEGFAIKHQQGMPWDTMEKLPFDFIFETYMDDQIG